MNPAAPVTSTRIISPRRLCRPSPIAVAARERRPGPILAPSPRTASLTVAPAPTVTPGSNTARSTIASASDPRTRPQAARGYPGGLVNLGPGGQESHFSSGSATAADRCTCRRERRDSPGGISPECRYPSSRRPCPARTRCRPDDIGPQLVAPPSKPGRWESGRAAVARTRRRRH